ncbi:metallophosphoesterase [Rhodoluna lacicola]|uniref:Putative phosphohydrolase n=1 Tax=Rhodoluna lacicola TaxID=529884 RepID=A0A060JKP6_9MICO|nr:putative phosphohydrolase [Rhodoluna lacicola]
MEWLFGIGAIGVLSAIWGIGIERFLFVIRRESVKGLPANSTPITVLHIGDIHLAPWQKRKAKFVQSLGRLKPDLVINTGDNLGHADAIGPVLTALAPLMERPGVFVNGSNDYYAPVLRNPLAYLAKPSERSEGPALDTPRLVGGFRSAGWLNLNNREGQITINGLKLGFIGVDDAHDELDNLTSIPNQANALADCDLVIGVSHAPYLRVLEAMGSAGASMIFAGHTHGGQVCLPVIGALTTNCDLPTKYARGISAWRFAGRDVILNVVAGLGHSIYAPVRFFCRPEVRLITLEAK